MEKTNTHILYITNLVHLPPKSSLLRKHTLTGIKFELINIFIIVRTIERPFCVFDVNVSTDLFFNSNQVYSLK